MRALPPPIRFLAGIVGLWVAVRVAVLAPWPARVADAPPPPPSMLLEDREQGAASHATGLLPAPEQGRLAAAATPRSRDDVAPAPRPRPGEPRQDMRAVVATETDPRRSDEEGGRSSSERAPSPDPAPPPPASTSRWSGDAYLFVRGDGDGGGLAPGGQLGGGQAFARLNYRLTGTVAATIRTSRALHVRDGEVALGLAWQPLRGVRLLAERRIAIERGGRDAWSALVVGGLDARRLGPLRLDGYAQAGVVGLRSRDLFADGALRVGREVGRLTAGAGLWAAAQPGVARVDAGPQVALSLPQGITVALDGRFRVAGDARPGSGVALTVAAGF